MNKIKILVFTLAVFVLCACDKGANSPKGFSLPEGDIAKGKQAFVKHQCLSCHTLEGIDRADLPTELDNLVKLGGESTKVTTYVELVTSIINPSHKISNRYKSNHSDSSGVSKMRNYNDVMSVSELVDIVSFLQPQYKVKPYRYTTYEMYYVR